MFYIYLQRVTYYIITYLKHSDIGIFYHGRFRVFGKKIGFKKMHQTTNTPQHKKSYCIRIRIRHQSKSIKTNKYITNGFGQARFD